MRTTWTPLLLSLTLLSCGDGGSGSPAAPPTELQFPGVGPKGIFDPSIERETATGRLWMAYSEVSDSPMWPGRNDSVRTRLARSDDAGASWKDLGIVVNPSQDVTLPQPAPLEAGTWNQEVPALAEDPGAPPAERWKLFWHRYLWVNGSRRFEHGWIAMKTAPAPDGPWSAERKLFVGSLYEAVNDATIGPPEVKLHTLHADLAGCLAATEPGLLATADALYVVLVSAEGPANGRIALLRWRHASPGWEYRGSFLAGAFTAPELFLKGATPYVIVTPQINDLYSGTHVYRIADLEHAVIDPVPVLQFTGTPGSHNGASGYDPAASASGILYSEAVLTPPIRFRIYRSGLNP